jgi:hypothetical protein
MSVNKTLAVYRFDAEGGGEEITAPEFGQVLSVVHMDHRKVTNNVYLAVRADGTTGWCLEIKDGVNCAKLIFATFEAAEAVWNAISGQ